MQKIFLKLFLLLAFVTTSVFSINYTHSLESSYFHKQVAERIYEKIENRYKNKTEIEKLIIYEVLSKKLDELILKVKDQDIKEVVKELKTYLTWESSVAESSSSSSSSSSTTNNSSSSNSSSNNSTTSNLKPLCPHSGWNEPNFCFIKWKPIWKVKEYYVNSLTWEKYTKLKKWSYTWDQAKAYCEGLWNGWRLPLAHSDFLIIPKDVLERYYDSRSIKHIPSHLKNNLFILEGLYDKKDKKQVLWYGWQIQWWGNVPSYYIFKRPFKPLYKESPRSWNQIKSNIVCVNTTSYFDNENYVKRYIAASHLWSYILHKSHKVRGKFVEGLKSYKKWNYTYFWFKCSKDGEEKLFSYYTTKGSAEPKCSKIFWTCKKWYWYFGPNSSELVVDMIKWTSHIFEWKKCLVPSDLK